MRGARTLWETMTLLKCAVISPCKTALLVKKQNTEHNPSTRPRNRALYSRPLPYIPHPLLTARSLIRPSTWNQATAPRLFLEQALDRGIFRKPNALFFLCLLFRSLLAMVFPLDPPFSWDSAPGVCGGGARVVFQRLMLGTGEGIWGVWSVL